MTTNQLSQRDEQMEAYRRDFKNEWAPTRKKWKQRGVTDREAAMMELQIWQRWLAEKRPFPIF